MKNFIGLKVNNLFFFHIDFNIRILFLAVKLSDTDVDKYKNLPNYWQQEQNAYSINELALNNEFQSMIINIE